MHFWTETQKDFLRANYPTYSRKELLDLFNQHFGLDIQLNQLVACLKNHKITSGRGGHFVKGQTAWNKGMKGLQLGGEKGWFKKGQTPINHRPVGSERITVDGYIEIKIAEPNKWALKHKHIWEQANGKVPAKHCLVFLDSDKQNVSLDNLALISRAQLVRLNQNDLIYNDPELTKSGILLTKYLTTVNSKLREVE